MITMDPDDTDDDQRFWNLELFRAIDYRKKRLKEGKIIEETILEEVKECLCDGADINAIDLNNAGNTILHVAIKHHYDKVIKFLLEDGAKVDLKNGKDLTAFSLAQQFKCKQEIIDLIESYDKLLIPNKLSITYWSKNQAIWKKFRNNLDFEVLEINSCELSPDFLHQVKFYDAIDTAGNLFFVDVMLSDMQHFDEVFIKSQLKRLNKQLIIQCGSISNTQVYFSVPEGNADVIDLNSPIKIYDEEILTSKLCRKDSFSIGLLVEGVKLTLVGTFETERRSLVKVNYYLEKHFNSMKLIDYAIQYGDVLTVRLLSLSNSKLVERNSLGESTLCIAAQHGDVDKLGAVLRVKFPIQLDKCISIPEETAAHFDKCKKQMLETAVRAGYCDVTSFMIRCGVQLDDVVIDLAWDNKRYDVVLIMLRADCVFPFDFDLKMIDENEVSYKELRKFVDERVQLHNLIKEGDLENVKSFVKSIPPSKLYLIKDGDEVRSALCNALRLDKLTIFVWLKCEWGAEFRNEADRRGAAANKGKLDSASEALLPHFISIKNAHILQLVAESKSHRHYPGFKEYIESIYMELNNIPQISTVLKVIKFTDQVVIIYDFDMDSIVGVDLSKTETEKGFCEYKAGRIYIGAKVGKRELLGTIAHELTHLATQTIYDNDCNPYKVNDPTKDHFNEIVNDLENRKNSLDNIISRVFDYDKVLRPRELIVRVNHMLATYGSVDGLRRLEKQAKALLEFYTEHVEKGFETLVAESHLIKPRNLIKVLNDISGVSVRIDESKIKLKKVIDVTKRMCDDKVQIAVVTSTSPLLSVMSIYQSLKEIFQKPNSFLMMSFNGYVKRRIEVNQAFNSDVCKFLVVLCESDPEKNDLRESLEQLAIALREKFEKKVIFVMENSELCKEGWIQDTLFNLSFEIYPDDKYTLDDVCVESAALLLDQSVSLQCRDIKLSSLINEGHFKLVDSHTLLKLINKQPIVIGKQIITSSQYDEHFYIDRSFIQELNKEDILKDVDDQLVSSYTEDSFVNDVEMHRVCVVSDTAGMGKTTLLTSLALRLTKKYPHLWVIRVDLNDYTKLLDKEQVNGALDFFVDKLLESREESRLETEFEKNLLLHFLLHNENRVVVMFDGFDEIKETHQNVIKDVLVALMSSKVKQLWVTTRPHMRQALEDTLHQRSYTMQPFHEEDQGNFLTRFWKCRLNLDSTLDNLQTFAKALMNLLSSSISDRENAFTGVPLQLRMVAECFEKDLEFCVSKGKLPDLPQKLQLIHLYQKFFDEKFRILLLMKIGIDFSKRGFETLHNVVKKHFFIYYQIASLFTMFDDEERQQLLTNDELNNGVSFISEIANNEWNAGIIDLIVDGRPRFVHLTFAEYFTAEFIVNQPNTERNEMLFANILNEDKFKVVRAFIDSKLGDKSGLKAVWNINRSVMRSVLSQMYRFDNVNNPFAGVEKTLLHVAAEENNANIVNILLICLDNSDIRARFIECVSQYGMKAHHFVTANGHLDVVKVLVEDQADVNAQGGHDNKLYDTFNALLLAAYKGHTSVCECLINNGADTSVTVSGTGDYVGLNALHLAAVCGRLDVVKMLKNVEGINFDLLVKGYGPFDGMNALHLAAFRGHWVVVKWIISEGLIDVNLTSSSLCFGEQTVLTRAVDKGPSEMVQFLFQHNVDINTGHDAVRNTALHIAVSRNRLEVVEMLLGRGAKVNAANYHLQTPLHLGLLWGSEQLVEFLLETGEVDINIADVMGKTPLHLAAYKNRLISVQMLLSKGASVNAVDCDEQTPLLMGVRLGSEQLVESLLKSNDINVDIADENGETALHIATQKNKLEIVRMLVIKGANVNAVNDMEKTPLDQATAFGYQELVDFLLTVEDIDVNAVDKNGRTALSVASMNDH